MSNQVLFRYRKEGLDADITAARKILAASAWEVESDPHLLLFTDRNKDKLEVSKNYYWFIHCQ